MKTLFLTVASRKYYDMYIKNLCLSLESYCDIDQFDILICTDNMEELSSKKFSIYKSNISSFLMCNKGLMPSLYKYHLYLNEKQLLEKYDYLFHIDSDMLLVSHVGNEILSDMVCTIHPGYYMNNETKYFEYETRPESYAFFDIQANPRARYYQNCFQGGSSVEFLKMCETIRDWVDKDIDNDIIAKWYDESYMNKYVLDHKPTLELPPSYAYPEYTNYSFEKKILHLLKNHEYMRVD